MTWDQASEELFRAGALGAMRSNNKIDAPELFLDAAIAAFQPNKESLAVEEIMRFMTYIKDIEYKVKRYEPHELEIGMQLPAGEGAVFLSMRANLLTYNKDGEAEQPEQASIDVSAVAMLTMLANTYNALRAAAPNLLPAGASGSGKSDNGNATIEEHQADSLEVTSYQGKKQFRIRAGWFSQYGAAVYPEVLKACGYGDIENLPVGTKIDFKHPITVSVKDGKPKVTKIS